jgi:hypothetical protein
LCQAAEKIQRREEEKAMPELELPNPEELEELRAKTFTKRIALTTAIFAVLLAISSLGGNHATKEMMLSQQQSSDQWAFYQAKAMRENLYKINGLRMEADLLDRGPSMKPNIRKLYASMLKDSKAEETRYRDEKKKIEEEARHLETERDKYRAKDPYFDYAEVLLQIAIVMASISILAVSRQIFYFAIGSASLGTLFMLNGFLLIFKLPFFH